MFPEEIHEHLKMAVQNRIEKVNKNIPRAADAHFRKRLQLSIVKMFKNYYEM